MLSLLIGGRQFARAADSSMQKRRCSGHGVAVGTGRPGEATKDHATPALKALPKHEKPNEIRSLATTPERHQ